MKKLLSLLLGLTLAASAVASSDYGPAIWRPAYSGHWYTSGYGKKFLVIHDIEGYYWSTISYFQNNSSAPSAHYAVNGVKDTSTDAPAGEVTQFVLDANYAWHAKCWNQHSMGTEHEGFASNPAWYTEIMYSTSGALQAAKCAKYGLAKDRNHVVGHDQKRIAGWPAYAAANLGIDPNCNDHTDPGAYFNWTKLMSYIGGASGSPTVNTRVSVCRTPNGQGYWIAASDGGIFSFGNAAFYGSMGGQALNSPVVGMVARPQGDGYWLVASDGGIFAFGAAGFYGSMGGQPLSQPVVGMAVTASGNGYWLVAKDGGIFAFGDAPFRGSLPGVGVNVNNITSISATPGNGYWLLGTDGGVFSFGANFYGSQGGQGLNDFCAVSGTSDGNGYWLLRKNGSVYSYGNAGYVGGANEPGNFTAFARGPSNGGYWLVKKDGAIYSYGDAQYKGGANF